MTMPETLAQRKDFLEKLAAAEIEMVEGVEEYNGICEHQWGIVENAFNELKDAVEAFNEKQSEAFDKYILIPMEAFNQKVSETNEWAEECYTELDDLYESYSVVKKNSQEGKALEVFRNSWSFELEPLDIDSPEDKDWTEVEEDFEEINLDDFDDPKHYLEGLEESP